MIAQCGLTPRLVSSSGGSCHRRFAQDSLCRLRTSRTSASLEMTFSLLVLLSWPAPLTLSFLTSRVSCLFSGCRDLPLGVLRAWQYRAGLGLRSVGIDASIRQARGNMVGEHRNHKIPLSLGHPRRNSREEQATGFRGETPASAGLSRTLWEP